jgi:TatD DNase family protein
MTWIDTHAHLDDSRYNADRDAVLDNARRVGLERIFTIGIDLPTSEASVRLARGNELLRAVVGIQPNHVHEAAAGDWSAIELLSQDACVVAVGETGLDHYWKKAPIEIQLDYFARHFELGRARDLPVIIHCREAEADTVAFLRGQYDRHGPLRAVMHSFAGDAGTAAQCLAMGLHLSFSGMVTYKTGQSLLAIAAEVPAERLLVETDAPYLTPTPHRGRRNEPGYVIHTGETIARARGMTVAGLAAVTTANARRLFRLA